MGPVLNATIISVRLARVNPILAHQSLLDLYPCGEDTYFEWLIRKTINPTIPDWEGVRRGTKDIDIVLSIGDRCAIYHQKKEVWWHYYYNLDLEITFAVNNRDRWLHMSHLISRFLHCGGLHNTFKALVNGKLPMTIGQVVTLANLQLIRDDYFYPLWDKITDAHG